MRAHTDPPPPHSLHWVLDVWVVQDKTQPIEISDHKILFCDMAAFASNQLMQNG